MENYKSTGCQDPSLYEYVDKLPPAMGYVPWQTLHKTMSLDLALQNGTIFPELCQPFCGRRLKR